MKRATKRKMELLREWIDQRNEIELQTEEDLREKYPQLKEVTLNDYSVNVKTEKHGMYISQYSINEFVNGAEPKMICDGENSFPESVDEYLEMKQKLEDDKFQCLKASHDVANIWLKEAIEAYKESLKAS